MPQGGKRTGAGRPKKETKRIVLHVSGETFDRFNAHIDEVQKHKGGVQRPVSEVGEALLLSALRTVQGLSQPEKGVSLSDDKAP